MGDERGTLTTMRREVITEVRDCLCGKHICRCCTSDYQEVYWNSGGYIPHYILRPMSIRYCHNFRGHFSMFFYGINMQKRCAFRRRYVIIYLGLL